MNRAPLVDENMLLAAGQIFVGADFLEDGQNVVIETEQRM